MNLFRRLSFSVSFLALLAASSLCFAGAKESNKGTTAGTFTGIEQGDYAHFQIKDGKGAAQSYFILQPDKSLQSYLDKPAKFKGKPVVVHWEEREENIPEAGGKQRIRIVTKVDEPVK